MHDVSGSTLRTSFNLSAEVSVLDKDGRRPEDYNFARARFYADLPKVESVGAGASARAFARLGSKKTASKKMTMVLENRSTGRLFGALLGPLAGRELQQRRSFLEGKIGSPIASSKLTVTDIPPEAYDYVVNGKSALEWVIERQCVKTDKASGIVNDANAWAVETIGNPRYPLELFLRVITVSLETMKIVRALPKLDIRTGC